MQHAQFSPSDLWRTHASPFYRLPQDLIDDIVDHLAIGIENESLHANADIHQCIVLTSMVWVENPMMKLTTRLEELFRLYQVNKHLIDYIHEIHLQLELSRSISWITEEGPFREIMAMKAASRTTLHKLTIEGTRYGMHYFENGFISNFMRPFVSPFIVCLHLKSIPTAPLEAIAGCVQLQELVLDSVDIFYGSFIPSSTHSLPRIKKLGYRFCAPAIELLVKGTSQGHKIIDLSSLQTLIIDTNARRDIAAAQEVINRASDSLEELYIGPRRQEISKEANSIASLDLCACTRLIAIKINLKSEGPEFEDDILLGVISTLKSLPVVCVLEALSMEIRIGDREADGPSRCYGMSWDRLGQEVNRISQGKKLNFSLLIRYTEPSYEDYDSDDDEQWDETSVAVHKIADLAEKRKYLADYLGSFVDRICTEKLCLQPNVVAHVESEVVRRFRAFA
ncbi:hypothetical protein NLJ89_g2046 [Agrocybe chaxingu]|uniref:Uncharacterized protein n=1 Tax=Agrocybe chaxingu TaxID=84603 RepID=A0A9W8K551_9AGAR|nr:hypothetical protein NLJ89_g2046 [Agrocybe chaxingu]